MLIANIFSLWNNCSKFLPLLRAKMTDKKRGSGRGKKLARNYSDDENRFAALISDHDYTEDDTDLFSIAVDEFPPLPATPSKPPDAKRKMTEKTLSSTKNIEPNLEIISTLSALINERSDALEKLVGENSRKSIGPG